MTDKTSSSPPSSAWLRWVVGSFVLSMAYAVIRYHVFGTTPWAHMPVFTTNKAISVASLFALAGAFVVNGAAARARLGITGFGLAVLHVLMTLSILGPATYPKLYEGDRVNFLGEVAMLTGCLATVLLFLPATATATAIREQLGPARWRSWQRAGLVAVACVGLHVTAIGFRGWLKPEAWPGYLPPITLGSLLIALVPFVVGRKQRRAQLED